MYSKMVRKISQGKVLVASGVAEKLIEATISIVQVALDYEIRHFSNFVVKKKHK